MRIFVIGCPHSIGGSGPHCWHTAKIWRNADIDVRFVAINPVEKSWEDRLESIGCSIDRRLIGSSPSELRNVVGLPGSITLSFCNGAFLELAPQLRILGCKTIWLGCMNWLQKEEIRHYKLWGPFTRFVFQSQYQEQVLGPELVRYGYNSNRMTRIPSPLDIKEFSFNPLPHELGHPFCLGRLSRADPKKFASNLWEIYGGVKTNLRARVMGWSAAVGDLVGSPPVWAECIGEGQETVQEFFDQIHCMIQLGQIKENRPRTCLEAMACGVPVVAPNEGGWKELIRHGHNGFLCNDHAELGYYVRVLAENEDLRMRLVATARDELQYIADDDYISSAWKALFVKVSGE